MKYTNALRALYRFAGRRKLIELDPEIMVRLDKFCTAVGAALEQARQQSELRRKEETTEELNPWHEKYEIWKAMNGKQA